MCERGESIQARCILQNRLQGIAEWLIGETFETKLQTHTCMLHRRTHPSTHKKTHTHYPTHSHKIKENKSFADLFLLCCCLLILWWQSFFLSSSWHTHTHTLPQQLHIKPITWRQKLSCLVFQQCIHPLAHSSTNQMATATEGSECFSTCHGLFVCMLEYSKMCSSK